MSKNLPTWLVVIAYVLLAGELLMVLYALVVWTLLFVREGWGSGGD